jgi:DNA-binding transcriptional ArsR family regulator
MCRWALPVGLLGLLLLAPLAGAAAPVPDQVRQGAAAAKDAVQDGAATADAVLGKALGSLQHPYGAPPDGPAPGDSPSDRDPADAKALLRGTVSDAERLVPMDQLEAAQRAAHEAADRVPRQVTGLLAPDPQVAPDATEAQPMAAAVQPVSGLPLAGSILVLGATAAAATYVVLWLIGSSGSLGAGAATPELRRLLPFASPLFTRFERGTVLGHPRREQLYARILQEPGISLQALGQATGLSRTAVVHHLRLLEQQHLVISRRVGRSRHYYENGGRYGHEQKEAYAILRNDRSKAVAEFIRGHPGTMQKTLCEALAIPPSIAHWHVRRLSEGGLVQTIRQGRSVAYFPGAHLDTVVAGAHLPEGAAAPMPSA